MMKARQKIWLTPFLPILLTLGLVLGATPAIAEEAGEDAPNPVTIEPTVVDTGAAEKSWRMDHVEGDYLRSHTDKTSEIKDKGFVPEVSNDDSWQNLSCQDQVYRDLGYDPEKLKEDARAKADDIKNQNPLAGLTFVDPSELMVGMVNIGKNSYETKIMTINDQAVSDPSTLDGNLENLERAADLQHWNQNDRDQTHAAVGVDIDGDGTDEYAYLTIYEGYKKSDWSGDSCLKVELFDLVDGTWTKKYEQYDTNMDGSANCYANDIEAGVAKGYAVITAGNFDHSPDGSEELAAYIPDRDDDNCEHARIAILALENGKLIEKHSIYLKDIHADYGKPNDDWFLPVVSLSTSSLRLGDKVEEDSNVVDKYEPYTDLVINVTMPKNYRKEGLIMNSSTAIYTFDSSLKPTRVANFMYAPFDRKRMTAVNSCEADLNGDGYKELVVAGLEESGLGSNDNTAYGSYSKDYSLVNVIYYDYDGSAYRLAWSTPKEVDALGTLDPEGFEHTISPIGLCGGHFDPNTPAEQDQICVQGVFYQCTGANITGPAVYVRGDDCIIVNTSPYKGKENFTDADGVGFTNISGGFNLPNEVGAVDSQAWISSCVAGRWLMNPSESAGTDCVVMITSDKRDGEPNQIYMDVSVAVLGADGNWKWKGYNDVLGGSQSEDDHGTCVFICMLDCQDDGFYYKYTGTYTTYSAPVLFSVAQVPPYYREANSASVTFDVTQGVTNKEYCKVGVGFDLNLRFTVKGVGAYTSVTALASYTHTWTQSKTKSNKITLHADQDYAVVYVVPCLVNTYDIICPADETKNGTYEIQEPMEAVFTALPIADYNAAVNNGKSMDGLLPADYSAPQITDDLLGDSCAGDPLLYGDDDSGIPFGSPRESRTSRAEAFVSSLAASTACSLTMGESQDNGASGDLTVGFGVIWGKSNSSGGGKINAGVGGGHTWSDQVGFSITYAGLSKDQPYGVIFGDDKYSELLRSSQINHYNPNPVRQAGMGGTALTASPGSFPLAASYEYLAVAISYPLKKFKVNLDIVDLEEGDHDPDEDFFPVYELSFYVPSSSLTPEPPSDFSLQSASINASDNSADITLAWDSTVRNERREPAGYNIYMRNVQAQDESTNIVYLQNDEGPIPRNTEGRYTTYTMHLENLDYSKNPVFYIVPVFEKKDGDGPLVVTEGIISDQYKLDLNALTSGAVTITEQPKSVYFNEGDNPRDALFAISASTVLSHPMKFEWQTWNRNANRWQEVKADDNHIIKQTPLPNPTSSEFEWKNAEMEVPVRCIVTCSNNSVQSNRVYCQYKLDPQLAVAGRAVYTYDGEPVDNRVVNCKSDAKVITNWYKGTTKLPSVPINAGTYTFKATVAETDTYRADEVSQTVTINKADPKAIAPTAEATYGQTLADVTLTNPKDNTPGTWTWADDTTGVGSVGTRKFKANFTPTDEANYNAKQDVDVTVTVLRAANPATVTNEATVVSGGNTIDLAKNVDRNGATGNIHYAFAGEANGCTLNGSMLTSGDTIGSTTVNVTVAADDNYNALDETPITVTVKGTQTIDAPDVTCTYGDTDKSVVASVIDPATGGGALGFAVRVGSEDYLDVDATTGALTLKKVGTAFVVVTAAETSDRVQATKEVTVTINKADAVPATVTANDRTYDATERPLVTVTGEPGGGAMRFALGTDGTTEPDASAYTDSIPTATNADTYHVWYKVAADANHNDTDAACVDVTVARATITSDDVTIDTPQVTFDGKEHRARVSVRLGDTELSEDDYEVSGTLAATDVGDYAVNVTGTGNYEGATTATWKIVPATHDNVALSMEVSPGATTAELDLTPYLVADATCGVPVIEGNALAGVELAGSVLTITLADVEAGASAAIRLAVTSNNFEAYEIDVDVSVRDKTTNVVLRGSTAPTSITGVTSPNLAGYTDQRSEERVDVSLVVTPMTEEGAGGDADAIRDTVGRAFANVDDASIAIEYFDVSVFVTPNGTGPEQVSDTGHVLDIALKTDMTDKHTPMLVRVHEGVATSLRRLPTRPVGPFEDGTFFVDGDTIHVYSKYFSTYSLAYTVIATHVVTLDEGDGIETKVVVPEGKLARPEEPRREGFRFVDWYVDRAFERRFDFERDIVNSSITLYAKWVPLPQASVTTNPAPVAGRTYTGSLQELVTAGRTDDGTLHYAIGDGTGTAPETGWSTSVPRRTDAGTYRVWYKVVADADHLDSDPRYVDAVIGRAPIEPSVTIDSWTEGETPSEPRVTGNLGGGTVTFRYSRANTTAWSSERPSTSGDYVVEATVAPTDNYLGNTCRTSFSILAKTQPTPTPHPTPTPTPSPTPTPTPLPSSSMPTTPWSYTVWGLGLMNNAYSAPSWRDIRPYGTSSGSSDETTKTPDTTNASGTKGAQTIKKTTTESTTANGTTAGGPAVTRLAGQDRYQTMAAICSQAFASSKRAIVASGDRFPDALAASGLAGAMDCPVVLTAGTTLSAEARSELSRLGVTSVTIVGGPAAVSEACRLELEAMGLHVTRIAGADRQATSVAAMAAARAEDPSFDTVIVASGRSFADALSAGPWAYRNAAPVLLVGNDGTLPHEALEALRADGRIRRVLVIGGGAAVSPMVEKQLGDYAVERVGGKDRYETSALLARWAAAHGSTLATVGVATGRTFPDALAASALLGSRGGVLLLADSGDGPAKSLLSDARGKVTNLLILGGTSAVGEPIAAALASAAA